MSCLNSFLFTEKLKGAEFLFDGFTGFTPIQVNVLRELLVIADRISVTVTMDEREDAFSPGKPYQLFFMSKQMIRTLAGLTRDLEDPVYLKPSGQSRFAQAPALQFLEKNIFRYRKGVYAEEQQEIKIFTAPSPLEEMREAARRMSELVRTCGYRYGEIAVITGNLEEYARLAAQVFEEADIPYFIDEKHSVMMNPFVEYLRAAMEMAVQGFPYESVFRYLRCGMSEVTREQADKLENYVLALGIRGYKKWSEKWVRVYRGMEAEKIQELNEIREIFAEEVRELAQGFGSGKKTVEEYCRILCEFIQKSNVWQKLKRQERKFKESGDKAMEKEYKQKLLQDFGIEFNSLYTLYNNPMGRFGAFLRKSGNLNRYMKKLFDAFNADTVEALMCRTQLSVDYDGQLYDCDFNLAAGMPVNGGQTIFDVTGEPYQVRKIRMDKHCYACTAGAGSS